MAKRAKRRGGAGKGPRRAGRGRRPQQRRARESSADGLLTSIEAALDADEPLPLLGLASTALHFLDPRNDLLRQGRTPDESMDTLLANLFAAPIPETSALLTAVATLARDDELRRRVRREVADRGDVLPRWLVQLATSRPARVLTVEHVLGDGDQFLLGVELPDGRPLTASVYVDHNLGTVVKDAFVLPAGPDAVVDVLRDEFDADTTVRELDPADARARLTEAIDHGAHVYPPLESDTWPSSRPLIEWMVGLLPEGGTGYSRPESTPEQRQELAARFLASPFAADLTVDDDLRELLDDLLWFGTDYGPGDPLRWSPVNVEILLADWIPRKIIAEVSRLERAPELLRALIRYSHDERGIREELTTETLDAVDEWETEYQEAIRTPRLQGPEALLARMGMLDEDEALAARQEDTDADDESPDRG
ncbi:hypothetical protein OF117_02490 [Geodermatophilus sp. YIM 151500]|uniref:hypothetical protein n=1 Tax=Geodermatophilus sp. YIM 151500 TaxID=2984531 RepID=UPI0021E366E4|nr:hypothetical protein [Geodermatophilus sp. YIM 151500]MCV2488221.1 hypothetical protein [Geodermatophilus sp. YIM 151500]